MDSQEIPEGDSTVICNFIFPNKVLFGQCGIISSHLDGDSELKAVAGFSPQSAGCVLRKWYNVYLSTTCPCQLMNYCYIIAPRSLAAGHSTAPRHCSLFMDIHFGSTFSQLKICCNKYPLLCCLDSVSGVFLQYRYPEWNCWFAESHFIFYLNVNSYCQFF